MASDPLNAWTMFLTQMIGLSVATERVTETAKQWLGSSAPTSLGPNRYAALVQTFAIGGGILVVALSGLNPIGMPDFKAFDWWNHADWLCWIVTGVLASGGSAFWNHLLDILQAAKVQKETLASNAVAAANNAQGAAK